MSTSLVTRVLAVLAAAVALADGLWAYFAEGSGVAGTAGALLAVLGAGAVLVAALLLLGGWPPRWLSGLLTGLSVIVAALTALAGFMLLRTTLGVAMLVALLAFLAYVFGAGRAERKRSPSRAAQ